MGEDGINNEADADEAGYDGFLAVLETPTPPPGSGIEPTKPSSKQHEFGHQETDKTLRSSFDELGEDECDGDIIYTDEELDAMRQIRAKLSEERGISPDRVGSIFLAVATINCKLRVDETVDKIEKMLEIMAQLGCPDGVNDELWKEEARDELRHYPPVGKDRRGCSTSWIRGGERVKKESERAHCQACIMQYLSVHADPNTLRNGVSFVIDLSSRDETLPKQGNEKLIQSFYQSIPQRPQVFRIVGCSIATRIVVNASIKLANIFVKQKILQRIRFVTMEEAVGSLPEDSAPVYVGGKGGGVKCYAEWAKGRLEMLPKPDL